MRKELTLPALGRVPPIEDVETRNFLTALHTIVESREGRRGDDYLDKNVTYRDLVNLGLITEAQVPTK